MCRKLIYLISFVLVFSLAGSTFATVYNYAWNNDSNSYGDGQWNRDYVDPNYNWQRAASFTPDVWNPSGPPESVASGDTSGQIWLTGDPNTRLMPVTIPAGYDANCGGKADEFQTIYGPEWGLKLDIYGKLSFRWTIAPVQGWEGLLDANDPNDLLPPDDPNRSVINMFDGSEIYGPWQSEGVLGGNRCETICLGLLWWDGPFPYVTMNMYGDSVVYTLSLHLGGHLNMYGGTMDITDYVMMGTRDSYTVPDELLRLDIHEGTLILPDDFTDEVEDWIDRGILLAYGFTPGGPEGTSIIIDTEVNPGRTTVTALPTSPPWAWGPNPADGATDVDRAPTLTWQPGRYADKHDVYFGTDETKVTDANRTNPLGVLVSENQDANTYDPCGLLERNQTYYWRIDEVNMAEDPNIWKGDVWSFTTADYIKIDNFDLYSTRDDLVTAWKDGYASYPTPTSGSNITLSTEIDEGYGDPSPGPIHEGRNAMQLVYDNDGMVTHYEPGEWKVDYYADYYSEIDANIADLPALSDWTIQGVKALALSFFGHPDNDANEQMYVVVEDGTGAEAIAKYGDDINEDMNNIRKPKWQQWNIDLTEFSDGGVDLNDVNKVYIGFGNRETPEAGGSGIVYFDSIRLYRPRCLPGTVTGDFDGDCKINRKDLAKMVAGWLGGEPSAPLVHLDAGDLSEGPVTTWVNAGTLGGKFDVNSLDPDDNPTRGTVNSRAAVIFDGNDYLIADFNAPGGITGANDFTVAIWAHNPQVANEECMVNWAKRGTSRRCAQLNYGLAPSSGAVTHWGVADMGYDGGVPEASMWHHIAVTYEGGENGTEIVWVDGKLNAIEHKTLNLWPDCPIYLGTAVQSDLITLVLHFSGSLAGVQVYDYALPEHEIVYLATGSFPADLNGDGKVNFKDLAILANRWLEGPILWP